MCNYKEGLVMNKHFLPSLIGFDQDQKFKTMREAEEILEQLKQKLGKPPFCPEAGGSCDRNCVCFKKEKIEYKPTSEGIWIIDGPWCTHRNIVENKKGYKSLRFSY